MLRLTEPASAEKPDFVCAEPGCGKALKSRFSLRRHHNLIHKRIRKYKCTYCEKAFTLRQYLREHENTHSREKPFVCGIDGCQERFRQRGRLCVHRKTHANYVPKSGSGGREYELQQMQSGTTNSVSKSPTVCAWTPIGSVEGSGFSGFFSNAPQIAREDFLLRQMDYCQCAGEPFAQMTAPTSHTSWGSVKIPALVMLDLPFQKSEISYGQFYGNGAPAPLFYPQGM